MNTNYNNQNGYNCSCVQNGDFSPVCDKASLADRIRMYKFALVDASLYLDAYPDNTEAIEFYEKTLSLLEAAECEYNKSYPPLSARDSAVNGKWKWTDSPWPWQCG